MLEHHFGDPELWPELDLICWTDELNPGMAWVGYRSGVFPMPLPELGIDGAIGWFSPLNRAVLPLDGLRVRRSLRKTAQRYTTTVDASFLDVLDGCADPTRPHGWIDETIRDVYSILHHAGYVHSIETWDEHGHLVGGLYGIHCHGMFAGESMFHDPQHGRDASKVALMRLVVELRRLRVSLLDVQWLTNHLASLGAIEISRQQYLSRLSEALAQPHLDNWYCPHHMAPAELLEGFDHPRKLP